MQQLHFGCGHAGAGHSHGRLHGQEHEHLAAGGSGRPISSEDKDLLREVAHNASLALNAAAEMRAAKLALAEEEQAAIAEALAATDDPKPELADGEEPPPEPEPEPEEPEAPQDGEDEDDAALRVNIAKTRKALEAAKANLSRKQKRFTAVDALLDGVDDEALGGVDEAGDEVDAKAKIIELIVTVE